MEKMKMETPDKVAENIKEILKLFPNCATEMLDKEKSTSKHKVYKEGINFELLKQMLSNNVVDGDEAYEFSWVGKKASIVEANTPIRKTLRPCKEESVNWDSTENLYIEGDNLEVLKLLQESYLGKVKMIYIDPPYNTGNDFIYRDNFKQGREEYAEKAGEIDEDGNRLFKNTDSNPRFHSDWCSVIYPRLMLARNLLTDDGVIFISIDEHESSNLKKICDETIGDNNFIGELVWEATTQPTNAGKAKYGLQQKTELMLLYAKNKHLLPSFNVERMESTLEYPHNGNFGKCRFEIIEKSDAGNYNRPTMKFKILGQYPRPGKRWQIGKTTAEELEKLGKVEIVDGIVKKAIYPGDEMDKISVKPFWSLFLANIVGTAQTGKEEINDIFNMAVGFDTVKPIALIKKILFHASHNGIILDFFSGSATTAHAIMQLNAEDGGKRRFIMVQLPEPCGENTEAYKAGYNNICEIGKERIRRAGRKIKEENADKPDIDKLDIGFRVFKVADSNMNDIYYSADAYTQDLITQMESNIKADRTELDLLFGCLLDWGIPLSLPYTSETIDGCTVHDYNDGDLIACFSENVPESVIREIAHRQPLRAVFRDSSFGDSPAKINAVEIFKTLAPETRVKVI